MNDRTGRDEQLERYLSGELAPEELRDGLAQEEAWLREVMGSLKEEFEAPPSLRRAIMREVERTPLPLWRRALDWAVRPRSVQVSPLGSAALALAATAALIFVSSDGMPTGAGEEATASAEEIVTRFVFVAPEARSIHVTGDFTSWSQEGIALDDLRGTGIWTVDVSLPPGVHEYTFIVDGSEWRPDPRAVSQVDDGFGRVNSVVIVSTESAA
jgi:hypothetical protein